MGSGGAGQLAAVDQAEAGLLDAAAARNVAAARRMVEALESLARDHPESTAAATVGRRLAAEFRALAGRLDALAGSRPGR